MHKRAKFTPLMRQEITRQYRQKRLEYKQKYGTTWWSKQIIYPELAEYHRTHVNTIRKIVSRWLMWDFSIHKSTRKDYRTFARNMPKIDAIQQKILIRKERLEGILRYEKDFAWELGHIDVHKARNIKGADPKKKKYLATLVDDASRLVFSKLLPDKKAKTLACFLREAVEWFRRKGIVFRAILTDNGKEFTTHSEVLRPLHSFEKMMVKLNIKHKYTRVRRPQTNGKVERWWRIFEEQFFQIHTFTSWKDFNIRFHQWLYYYNFERKHGGIQYLTPWEKYEKSLVKTQMLI